MKEVVELVMHKHDALSSSSVVVQSKNDVSWEKCKTCKCR